jgi:hypothetical protein
MPKPHLFVQIALCLAASGAAAQVADNAAKRKYCGSGFTEALVPESPFGCKMSEACKSHDACYSKCDPGGSLYGTAYCAKSEFSAVRVKAKLACEAAFYKNILKANDGRWACKAAGAIYVATVGIVGQGPFNGLPLPPRAMEDLILTSNSIEEIKTKAWVASTLSQRGVVNLQDFKRVDDRLDFAPLKNGDLPVGAKLELPKGIDAKTLKALQMKKLTK